MCLKILQHSLSLLTQIKININTPNKLLFFLIIKKWKLKIIFKYYFSANKILRHKCFKYVYFVLWNASSFWNKPSDTRQEMRRPGRKKPLSGILVCNFLSPIQSIIPFLWKLKRLCWSSLEKCSGSRISKNIFNA